MESKGPIGENFRRESGGKMDSTYAILVIGVREILKIALFIESYISKWEAGPFRDRDL